ncbi:pyridoxamine 5'-phosphate oxidase family protein [Fundidesulfovibrio putealis]|uniref:pyridoxamine 5'-phosphate oxidase family protein n=1 Tax=Fundidesulfovibrio putealis TaxID=270496 RepID=UPI00041B6A55|nr:pyridoxamine 5'-phosphate oxidase family protein [Fundidesulfovibrio putealis]
MPIPEEMAQMIRERDLCVLATSAGDLPHASLMSYAVEPNLQYIHMATPANTRKWANLKRNPNMALLIDEREKALAGNTTQTRAQTRALTVGCELFPVDDDQEKARILGILAAAHPHLRDFLTAPEIVIIRGKPLWLLLLTGAEHSEFINL